MPNDYTKPLSAAEMPTGIDAAKLANGSVSNAEFQTLSDISTGSTIQTQINGKAATPTGTPNGSKFLRDDNSWQTPSATDATKMPLTGGQFTGLASTKITPTSCVINTWTTIGSVSGFTQCVLEVEVAGSGSWVFNWDGSTLTARAGTATPFVVNGTGAYEIGVRVNSNNVQVYMGGGIGTKNGGLVALKGH